MLTHIEDLDYEILKSLSLKDVRMACQISPKINKLCSKLKPKLNIANEKAENLLNFIDHEVRLYCYKIEYGPIRLLMKDIGLNNGFSYEDESDDESDESDESDDNTDHLYCKFIKMSVNSNNYELEFVLYEGDEFKIHDAEYVIMNGNYNQIKELLINLIYDRVVFTF